MKKLTIKTSSGNQEVLESGYLNKGEVSGETWLLAMHCSNFPALYIIEAGDEQEVIDAFIDHPAGSHYIHTEEDLAEIPEDYRHYTSEGVAYDGDSVLAIERCEILSE